MKDENFILYCFNDEEERRIVTEIFRDCQNGYGGILSHSFRITKFGNFIPMLTSDSELALLCEADFDVVQGILKRLIRRGFVRKIRAVEEFWTGERRSHEGYAIRAYLDYHWKDLVERFEEDGSP